MSLAHGGGDGGAEGDVAEQLVEQLGLRGVEHRRWGRGQSDDRRVGKTGDDLGQQPAPDLEQVVALVEDERDRSGSSQRGHQLPTVGVQPVDEALRLVGVVVVFVGSVERGQRLVGQHRDGGGQIAVDAGPDDRWSEVAPRVEPLPLDRGVGHQHDDRVAATASDLQSEQRLAGAGGQRHPQSPSPSGEPGLDLLEGPRLQGAQGVGRCRPGEVVAQGHVRARTMIASANESAACSGIQWPVPSSSTNR
jgi:hypothetical protein